MTSTRPGRLERIALIGSHSPRQCGIATFTSDLADALSAALPRTDVFVAAVNEPRRRHEYPRRVRIEIAQGDIDSYRRAGDAINESGADSVSLQHEYGIYGGVGGSHVLALVRQLRVPVVTTLHTLVLAPSAEQRTVMDELTRLSSRVVVMSQQGASILRGVHGVPASKVDFIPHGIPSAPLPSNAKHQLGLTGRAVILTYGLLSPDKGIETVIEALPEIAARHPDVVYLVVGTTHPHVRESQGETYREMLVARARELGQESRVVFRDRYVSPEELAVYLGAADVYVTPYLQPEQITSGTLAYALGSGKAVVSTPYRYARELLAHDRGVLVPWRDPVALGREVAALLSDGARRASLGASGRALGLTMHWPVVAALYGESLSRACADLGDHARRAEPLARRSSGGLPAIHLDHLEAMTDSLGVLQHATYDVPRYADGYCLDDNARGLLLTALLDDEDPSLGSRGRALQARYLAFVSHAFEASSGRFRNFMSFSRTFASEPGSEDCHGRALWALGRVIARPGTPGTGRHARELFVAALPATLSFTSPRAWAYALLGLAPYLESLEVDHAAEATRLQLAARLLELLDENSSREWPWFEDRLTYANARLSEAMIVSGAALGDAAMLTAGLRSLDWLCVQQHADEILAPIGAPGWWVRGEERARFDQQPLEAAGMVSACLAAHGTTGDPRWTGRAERAVGWFMGDNELQQSLYDARTGGCRDGLHAERVNENQGAESTLSALTALAELHRHRRELAAAPRSAQ